ncbi:MAG TPA: rod shape-determining protein RodA [Bacteroidales bacterium]|nr:rod shape-determining protein RodA [Bacteroidales bacterium]
MQRSESILNRIDWTTVLLWLVMMIMGWFNIYATVYNEQHNSIFDLSQRYGKQLIWIFAAIVLAVFVTVGDNKLYFFFAWLLYGTFIFLLILVLVLGKEINGARSWFEFGGFSIQPSEFAKFATGLALASYLNSRQHQMSGFRSMASASSIILAPALLIALQPDMGSVITYFAFFIVLFREGMSIYFFISAFLAIVLFLLSLVVGNVAVAVGLAVIAFIALWLVTNRPLALKALGVFIGAGTMTFIAGRYILGISPELIILVSVILSGIVYAWYIFRYRLKMGAVVYAFLLGGILYLFTVDYAFHNILQPHQQTRINILIGLDDDPFGKGYNLNQSMISIGSGGFTGKGYLNGTQTRFKFVPEQSTDFIFCTVGEEWGFIGSLVVTGLFIWLLLRLLMMAERQRSTFVRAYGYGVFSLFLVHFFVNIGMTIGIMPVIGIPLPFFSYGGSSLWSFTILLFIFLRLDASRTEYLG